MTVADAELEPSVSVVDGPWREVPAAPVRPVHAACARLLLRRALRRIPIRVALPDGSTIGRDPDPLLRIHRDEFFHRVGTEGLIGFGEAYMAGDWGADDLDAVLRPLAAATTVLVPGWMQCLRGLYVHRVPRAEENTTFGARRNVARHYDLSNDLFGQFLDPSMTYSSALFDPGDSLETAQHRKIDRLLDAAGVGVGSRVLEIGTGWGGLAIRAARRGAAVTSLTLSAEQRDLARRRIAEAGLSDRVDVQLRDYRDARGEYDAVVSVEMIEAVGEQYWPTFFRVLDRVLVPGGRIGLQAIVVEHDRLLATRDQYTWVHKYIFPGGALPSVRAIDETLRGVTTLSITDRFTFGPHYETTLHHWRARFDARTDEIGRLGFDATFRRMWDFYLSYAAAGFATGYLDVVQLVLDRET